MQRLELPQGCKLRGGPPAHASLSLRAGHQAQHRGCQLVGATSGQGFARAIVQLSRRRKLPSAPEGIHRASGLSGMLAANAAFIGVHSPGQVREGGSWPRFPWQLSRPLRIATACRSPGSLSLSRVPCGGVPPANPRIKLLCAVQPLPISSQSYIEAYACKRGLRLKLYNPSRQGLGSA